MIDQYQSMIDLNRKKRLAEMREEKRFTRWLLIMLWLTGLVGVVLLGTSCPTLPEEAYAVEPEPVVEVAPPIEQPVPQRLQIRSERDFIFDKPYPYEIRSEIPIRLNIFQGPPGRWTFVCANETGTIFISPEACDKGFPEE